MVVFLRMKKYLLFPIYVDILYLLNVIWLGPVTIRTPLNIQPLRVIFDALCVGIGV